MYDGTGLEMESPTHYSFDIVWDEAGYRKEVDLLFRLMRRRQVSELHFTEMMKKLFDNYYLILAKPDEVSSK